MEKAQQAATPVATLTAQVVALDAAMLVATASAEAGAVHKLRTTTRRVQAQLLLVEKMRGELAQRVLPRHANEVAAVTKRLKLVRRAAGAVRDLDVQRQAILLDAPAKGEVGHGTTGAAVRAEAKALRKALKKRREHEAEKLKAVLDDEAEGVAVSLRALEEVLKPAEGVVVTQRVLLGTIARWFARTARGVLHVRKRDGKTDRERVARAVQRLDEDALHAVRKAAKLCRYMAEGAGGTGALAVAAGYEAMQEAGGAWHDWLLLHRHAARFHGKSSALAQRYRVHRDAALEEYRLKLVEVLPAAEVS